MFREDTLFNFWERTVSVEKSNDAGWNDQVRHLSQLGIGMEDALKYLYTTNPSFETFRMWVKEISKPVMPEEYTEKVFTDEDLEFWEANGYIVLKNAVSAEQCDAARNAIWEFLDGDPADMASWYRNSGKQNGLMLSFFNHPALDVNRRSAKISKAYKQLYGSTETYLLIDKVSFNPPVTNSFTFAGSPLHWDVSLQLPIPYELQGLLYLNDVEANDGAFHCVPGFHKKIDEWLGALPENANPRDVALAELEPVPVTGNAGDMVIWHQALPHCATPNTGTVPRMVQYIAYKPVSAANTAIWK